MSRDLVVERSTRASRIGSLVAIGGTVVLALGPVLWEDAVLRMILQFSYLLALAQMWNLLAGYAGLVSIGQQAYVGIGAYALLWLVNILGVNVLLAVLLAGLVAAVLSMPTAALVFRLRGGYFAIGTWVVAEVYRLLVANTTRLGGGSGATIRVVGIDPTTRLFVTYWIALGVAIASVLVSYLVLRSRLGLALRAVRDREGAAPAVGIDVRRTKFIVYVLASTICGLTGSVIYLSLLRVQPAATFSVNWTAFMIFAVVIGGIGTIAGPIVGALIFFMLQEWLADLGALYLVILGVVAIVMVVKFPRGVWGYVVARWDVRLFPEQVRVRLPGSSAHRAPGRAGGGE